MKKFAFRFKTLLKARELEEEKAKKEYFQAYEIVLTEMNNWKKILSHQEMLTQEYDQLKTKDELKRDLDTLKTNIFNVNIDGKFIKVYEEENYVISQAFPDKFFC